MPILISNLRSAGIVLLPLVIQGLALINSTVLNQFSLRTGIFPFLNSQKKTKVILHRLTTQKICSEFTEPTLY